MSQLKQIGTFLFDILDACVQIHKKSGLPQWVADLLAVAIYDEDTEQWVDYTGYEDREIRAYLFLAGKDNQALFHVDSLMKITGWDSVAYDYLDELDYSSIQLQGQIIPDDYKGGDAVKVGRIDHKDTNPSRSLQRLDKDSLKKLNAKFSKALREKSGGPKPKSIPAPIPPQVPINDVAREPSGPEPPKSEKPKTEKPKKPAVPKPPAKKAPPQDTDLPETCTQEEAWETCAKLRTADISDDDLANAWMQVIGDLGGEEMLGDNWAKVRDVVLTIVQ